MRTILIAMLLTGTGLFAQEDPSQRFLQNEPVGTPSQQAARREVNPTKAEREADYQAKQAARAARIQHERDLESARQSRPVIIIIPLSRKPGQGNISKT